MSQTETRVNQHGFYALPKTLQTKRKYRNPTQQSIDDSEESVLESIDQEPEQPSPDFYIDQAPYPQFKPKERGLDYGVQVQDSQLFNYTLQVKPLIQILVGRAVVTALNELQEEKQASQHTQSLQAYQRQRNAQLMLTQRMEAKHTRKQEEVARRKLQKEMYIRNQREIAKKVTGRGVAKRGLMGLKQQVLNEMEEKGPLRTEAVYDLRVHYEDWLYDQVMHALHEDTLATKKAETIIRQEERNIIHQHQSHIDNQTKRRKEILDAREKNRKQIQEKKEKKKMIKMRLALRGQREAQEHKIRQHIDKHQDIVELLKCTQVSNGLGRNERSAPISGGVFSLFVYLLQEKNISVTEVQKMLDKLLRSLAKPLEINIIRNHEHLLEAEKRMNENPTEYMKTRGEQISSLSTSLQLDLSLLQHIPTELHTQLLSRILDIVLIAQPDASYEMTDSEKRNLQLREKIVIVKEDPVAERIRRVKQIVRVRFEKEESTVHQEQYIDVYDGEGWKEGEIKDRAAQNGAAYLVQEGTFVYDERNIHYAIDELEKVLGSECGRGYGKHVESIVKKSESKPIYDMELCLNE